jgi:hypothetical protein
MFTNTLIALAIAILSLSSALFLITRAEVKDLEAMILQKDQIAQHLVSTENYICVIPEASVNSNLPCRVKMREDVYIQNAIDTAPKD